MINLDNIVNDNNKRHNEKWPYIPDHPFRILIIAGSGSGKKHITSFNKRTKRYGQNLFVCKRFK